MLTGRAYLIMRSVIKDTEFPVFDGYMLASSAASDLTNTGFLYSTILEVIGTDFKNACDSFMETIYGIDDPFFISLREWFPRTYEEHKKMFDLKERVSSHQEHCKKESR